MESKQVSLTPESALGVSKLVQLLPVNVNPGVDSMENQISRTGTKPPNLNTSIYPGTMFSGKIIVMLFL